MRHTATLCTNLRGDDVAASIHRVVYDALAVAREMRTADLPAELADKLVAAA